MRPLHKFLEKACAGLLLLGVSALASAAPQKTAYSTVELIAERATLTARGTTAVGLHLVPDSTWHAYWSNPGDAGMAPSVRWTLPDGFKVTDLAFPTPHLLPFGELNTYGYKDAELFIAELSAPDGLTAGEEVIIAGAAHWVVCDDKVCVPERAELELKLTVGAGEGGGQNAGLFAEARERLPETVDWPASFALDNGKVDFEIDSGGEVDSLDNAYLFIESKKLVAYGTQYSGFTSAGLSFTMDAGANADSEESTAAVLSFTSADGTHRSVALNVTKGSRAAAAVTSTGGMGLVTALLFAFFGGVILNLMPCVFPILSMKALSLVNLGQADRTAARDSGIFYTLGILAMFAAIGISLLALRSAGEAIGWGFQLQSTGFLVALTLLMVAIGLNLFGVFEFGTRVMGVGQGLTEGGERKSAFFTGLLAVVVATPCTAPLMAGALGYALVQPVAIALAILLVMGIGLALPYLLLSFVPAFGRVMPKPGAWMDTFRHVLAFPMFLVAIWLLWIIGGQLGSDAVAMVLVAVLLLSIALWAYGKGMVAPRKLPWRAVTVISAAACVYAAMNIEDYKAVQRAEGDYSAGMLGGLQLERFEPERVKQYVTVGQPVFVYFTADWCVSCKVNERVALATDTVTDAFNSRGIKVVEGDWTAEDAVITAWLEMYNRVGVPLYLYFPEGSSLEDVAILPQILTPGLVVDAIKAADARAADRYASKVDEAEEVSSEREQYTNFQIPEVEPDWSVVQAYIDVDAKWHAIDDEIRASDATSEEKEQRKEEECGPHPEILDAQAAATAIVKLGGKHKKTYDAAVFLVEHLFRAPGGERSIMLGLQTIKKLEMEYGDWEQALFRLDFSSPVGWFPDVDAYFDSYEANVPNHPLVRATALYYAASRQLRFANAVDTPPADRAGHRQRGIELATGLSKGVESEELIRRRRFTDDGEPIPFPTMADAEADLLYNLDFLTVGSKIPGVAGKRLDGTEESIAAFEGQAVLLDFWATWCGPCVASIPKLVDLDQGLPEGEFEILSISVDEEVATVTEFQGNKPMDWANWHVGPKAELLQTWAVRGYPTYILIDHNGTIVARQSDLNRDFIQLIKDTACGLTGSSSC
jgi:thiol:disulfide interchange protein DsbD